MTINPKYTTIFSVKTNCETASLDSKKDNTDIFTKGTFNIRNRMGEEVEEYLIFRENIKRYKYPWSNELRSAIDNYVSSPNQRITRRSIRILWTLSLTLIRCARRSQPKNTLAL